MEERNINNVEDKGFDPNNGLSWNPDSLEFIRKQLEAGEINSDGIVCLYCLRSDPENDSDEIAWEIQKVLIYHLMKTDLHRNINEESCMTRQGMEPVSRKVRTPGRGHDGYLVYLSYQLVDHVTFQQVIGETILYSSDIRSKKKQLMNSLGENRFPTHVEEKTKKNIEQVENRFPTHVEEKNTLNMLKF
ncbi:uncharacterized protein LOC111715371 [Eurytemora carolleeae]|uniref:uncharacterized protein LOC111715371 n=1 Tax=Eurytemora carolleeae TaxID=1294199 RepID=UPI000C777886|nr:uncharacterized protein LOC111715371 [Eurytemora carolleeae]|eukprot:XP_023346453.1 uncharacterized protein LOC111715371 [Eurytemora affinis]